MYGRLPSPLPSINDPQELQEERRVLRAEIAAEQAESEQTRLQVTLSFGSVAGGGLVGQAGGHFRAQHLR